MPNKLLGETPIPGTLYIWTIFKRVWRCILKNKEPVTWDPALQKSRAAKPQTGFLSNTGKLVCSPLSPHLKWLGFFYLVFPKAMQCEAQSKSESILALEICLAKLQASKMELCKKEVSGKLMLPIPPIKMFTWRPYVQRQMPSIINYHLSKPLFRQVSFLALLS